jgi:hypothetical protein
VFKRLFFITIACVIPVKIAFAAPAPAQVVILGVSHGAELINPKLNPGRYRSYIDAVAPDLLLIERDPRRATFGDWYEFTYEQQHIVLPYAREHHIPVVPFGWQPPATDAHAIGMRSLEVPPPVRSRGGFQGMLSFEPEDYKAGFFFADSPDYRQRIANWAYQAKPSGGDFGRRLYLYRTLMMSAHIAAIARQHPGQRLLVVVGAMHVFDLEGLLGKNPAVALDSTDQYKPGAVEASYQRLNATDCAAIYSVNLLSGAVPADKLPLAWLQTLRPICARQLPGPEMHFYEALTDAAAGLNDRKALLHRLRQLAAEVPAGTPFSWQAAGDRRRLDTVYDPFGRLDLGGRIRLLAMRLDGSVEDRGFVPAPADRDAFRALRKSLNGSQRAQFDYYLRQPAGPVLEKLRVE